ncbi:MAG: phospholipid carrier-dependent glycosyltransferase [Candidatus Daviesbacteria bacterium]|nr:phospholipid carrier-dependent glycosyltransferase [Candidatus Daviesbacteria bacterium]
MKKNNTLLILLVILIFSFGLRIFRINYPNTYVFDEVYHAFTAKEYLKGSREAWIWWSTPPKGVAYEWTHPPLAKEIMATSMFIFHSTDAWAWRLPGVILGTVAILFIFQSSKLLFKSSRAALISSLVFSLDGINFVQSRIGMNDIYLIFFILCAFYFLLKQKLFWTGVFLGLSLASKWTTAYFLIILVIVLFKQRQIKKLPLILLIVLCIYLLSYLPFFYLGFNGGQFLELQQQMWWYHTNLKATHAYASPWWTWPLNLVPVWYFVEYRGEQVANIFTSGNAVLSILGLATILISLVKYLKQKSFSLLVTILAFNAFWLPWAFSPRIMFLYHFAPAIPFLSLILGYQLDIFSKNRFILFFLLFSIALGFVVIYPILTGVFIPKNLLNYFFLTNLARNPF